MSSPGPSISRRPYRSERRRDQAAATRRAILEAARARFLDLGYVGTTIAAIAAAAGVSPETVYATFGTKRAILAAVVDVSIAGDVEAVPLLERDWVRRLVAEPDLDTRITLLAHHGSLILARRAPMDRVVREAAGTDPEVRELHLRGRRERRSGQRRLVEIVAGDAGEAPGFDLDQAADIVFATGSPEVYELLVEDCGWSHEQFADWYGAALRRLVFPDRERS